MRSVIVAQLRAIKANAEAALAILGDGDDQAPEPEAARVTCPKCGNTDEEQFQDSSVMGIERVTCTKCGTSIVLLTEAPKE